MEIAAIIALREGTVLAVIPYLNKSIHSSLLQIRLNYTIRKRHELKNQGFSCKIKITWTH